MNLLRRFQAFFQALSLFVAIRRLLRRRRARQLRALGLPSAAQAVQGLLAGPRPTLPLALRSPGPLEPPARSTELWALPLGAQAVRRPGSRPERLLRLAALPPPLRPLGLGRLKCFGLDATGRPGTQQRAPSRVLARPLRSATSSLQGALSRHTRPGPAQVELGVLRPRPFGLDEAFARHADRAPLLPGLRSPQPLPPPVLPLLLELGAARPEQLGLDEDGRFASEREPLQLTSDRRAPPPPGHLLPKLQPPAPAPLWRLQLRHFRLDPVSATPANEGVVDGYRPPPRAVFLLPAFDRELCQPRWMARSWISFLSARPVELFAWWWLKIRVEKAGAKGPIDLVQPEDISYALFHHNKEQMLIRRDVVRDQEGPGLSTYEIMEAKPQIQAHARLTRLGELVPKKQWIERLSVATEPVFDQSRPAFDAYVQWRTLLDGLEER